MSTDKEADHSSARRSNAELIDVLRKHPWTIQQTIYTNRNKAALPPGTDPSFGERGTCDIRLPFKKTHLIELFFPLCTRMLPDNGILIAGVACNGPELDYVDWHYVISKVLPDGRLDEKFGNNGVAMRLIGESGADHPDMGPFDIQTGADGRIYLFLSPMDAVQPPSLQQVICVTASGKYDSSFGDRGVYAIHEHIKPIWPHDCRCMGIDKNGLYFGSRLVDDNDPWHRFVIWRIDPRGRPDPSFGNDGQISFRYGYRIPEPPQFSWNTIIDMKMITPDSWVFLTIWGPPGEGRKGGSYISRFRALKAGEKHPTDDHSLAIIDVDFGEDRGCTLIGPFDTPANSSVRKLAPIASPEEGWLLNGDARESEQSFPVHYITKINSNGHIDRGYGDRAGYATEFPANAALNSDDYTSDKQGRCLILRYGEDDIRRVFRLTSSGHRDRTYGERKPGPYEGSLTLSPYGHLEWIRYQSQERLIAWGSVVPEEWKQHGLLMRLDPALVEKKHHAK